MNLPNVPHNHALTANAIFLNTINEYRGISHRQSEDIKKLKAESTQLQTQLSVKTAELQGTQSMVGSVNQRLTHAQNSLRGSLDLVDFDEIKQKQETMVRMINHITLTSQSLDENQKTIMGNTAGGPPPTTRIIKIPVTEVAEEQW